jgi:CTP:molybdopterin cytidylyltransferase MocA
LPETDIDPGRKKIGAVLLAAGAGSRMGHRPKSLLELDGEPLICRQLRALATAGVAEVVLVLGHYAEQIEKALTSVKGCAFTRVLNPNSETGQSSSLRLGLQALSPDVSAVLVVLADQPLIDADDMSDLIRAYEERPAGTQFVQPTVQGLPGNPVLFSAAVRAEILQANARVGGQQWKSAHPDQVHLWTSTNSHYRLDVDTPEDIAALVALGHCLSWPAGVTASV